MNLDNIYDKILESHQTANFIQPNDCLENIRHYKMLVPDLEEWDDATRKIYSFILACCKRRKSQQAPVTIDKLAELICRKRGEASRRIQMLVADGWFSVVKKHSSGNHGTVYGLTRRSLEARHEWIESPKYQRKPSIDTLQNRIDIDNEKQRKDLSPVEAQIVKSMHRVRFRESEYNQLATRDNFDTPEAWSLFQNHANEIGTQQIGITTSCRVGRIFHSGNLCDKRLRKVFTNMGRPVIEIDAVAMHPQMLTNYCTDVKELNRVVELANNDFYGLFSIIRGMSRDQIKIAFNAYLNGATKHSSDPNDDCGNFGLNWVKYIFETSFPILAESIDEARRKKNIGRELQRLESSVFIGELGKWAVANDKFYIPIHDAVICDNDDVVDVIRVVLDGFQRILGRDIQLSFTDKFGDKQIISRVGSRIQINKQSSVSIRLSIDDISNEVTKRDVFDLFLSGYPVTLDSLNPVWINQLEIQGKESVADDGTIYVGDGLTIAA